MNVAVILLLGVLTCAVALLIACQICMMLVVLQLLPRKKKDLSSRIPPPKAKKDAVKTADDEKRSQSVLDVIENY